ncbi:MAG: preprotein translocase subunit YajC [Clostridiales Family XIII bacterium]|jgi:preprotein translocase subunit YajC|nr:preprotein translocase subunit YajC [Clostridiales Family XIII bacterium]
MRKGTKRIVAALAGLTALALVVLTGCYGSTGTGDASGGTEGSTQSGLMSFLPLILIIAVMYFVLIRPQQKKTKQVNEMRSGVKVGDWVTTIGGFRGRVVKIKDEVVTIAVGSDKTKLDIMRWGISKIDESAPPRDTAPAKRKSAKEREEELEEQQKKPKKLTKPAKKEAPVEEPEELEDADAVEEAEEEATEEE